MLILGNWKMNGGLSEAVRLASEVVRTVGNDLDGVSVGICPPFIWLEAVAERLKDSPVVLGAQNVYPAEKGAFTGEVSVPMLREVGCRYVIVGHSERRALFGESDAFVGEKAVAVQAGGLTPVVAVGETLDERKADRVEEVVGRQLEAGIPEAVRAEPLVIAYEPVWAIGTGETATPEQAQEVHAFIRSRLSARFDDEAARTIPILYGGSVKPDNAADLFARPDIDGGLIGGASLDAASFAAIVSAASADEAD